MQLAPPTAEPPSASSGTAHRAVRHRAAMADLAEKLATYAEQLAQVEQLLQADPSNDQFLKLRTDLLEVTKLTEDLLKYKHEQSESQQPSGDGGEAEGAAVDVSPFQVGMRCEGKFDDGTKTSWYPAVITAVSPDSYTLVYIGFGNTEAVGPESIRPLICESPLDPSQIDVGFECVGRYSGDGKYYEVVVEAITDFGYKVQFQEYGNSEELPLEYLRPKDADGGRLDANELYREADGSWRIPDHLRVSHTDSEQERLRKRRKVKALKQKDKQREKDEVRDGQKNSWLAFQSKGAKRKVAGSMKGARKGSIFASPDTVDGRVGVTGSGAEMTEFGERKKYKIAPPLP